MNGDYEKFEGSLRNGCQMRFVLVDPNSDAIVAAAERWYAERSHDSTRERVRHTIRLLGQLQQSTQGAVSLRLTSHPLATGTIATDSTPTSRSEASALFVEYYAYRALGEPKFVLQPADGQWNERFLSEAEALWENAAEYSLDNSPPTQ